MAAMIKTGFLIGVLVLATLSFPWTTSADLIPCGKTNPATNTVDNPCDFGDFETLIAKVFTFLTRDLALPIAAGVIVYGGVLMVTAGTNESRRSQAKSVIGKAVVGLLLALAAWLLVYTLMKGLGVADSFLPDYFQ